MTSRWSSVVISRDRLSRLCLSKPIASLDLMVLEASRVPLVLALLAAFAPGATAEFPHTAQNSPVSIGATQFRDIARRQNPAVVSIIARVRGRAWDQEELDVFRLFGVLPPDAGGQVERVLGSGFVIS